MQRNDYTEANRAAWNEAAPVHARRNFERLREQFARPGTSCLDPIETAILRDFGLDGKSVVQICCNNGRELLSIKNLGAARCVGFDISDAFIDEARLLAAAGNIDCTFVRSDVYEIPAEHDATFDIAYVSVGVLTWMPDLAEFFRTAARLLKPGGRLLVYELHPAAEMFEPEAGSAPPAPRYSYFEKGPIAESTGLDYYGGTRYAARTNYSFHHTLGDIFEGCLRAGFAIRSFREYGHDIANIFAKFADMEVRLPLCYTLTAERER
jgi:ubiquinone/menaquinone biosynthesis C-methylase UbiE